MKFDIERNWQSDKNNFRSQAVRGTFTLSEEKFTRRWNGEIPLENLDWSIGLIVGRSGTGKTTIGKEIFKDSYFEAKHSASATILDDFPKEMSIDEITKLLGSVGFSSPPDWLKSYEYLSQGEKMRVDIALSLAASQNIVVFDEFTSVVDREIAKVSCAAISKAIRRSKEKKFVAISCHYDIMDWLDPDWIFYTDEMRFEKRNLGEGQPLSWQSKSAISQHGRYLGTIII